MKVAVLFDNFGPYHHARLTAAAGVCDLLAVEFGSRSGEYAWVTQGSETLRHAVINPDGPGQAMPATVFREKLGRILSDFGPAVVVIPGWSNRGGFLAMAWARAHRIPIVLMSESTAWDEARVGWKEWIKRRIVGLSSTALVGGRPHAEYMRQLGMPEERIFLGYDVVDNDYFAAEAAKWMSTSVNATDYSSLLADHSPPYFLTSNRFIEKKNLFRLLEAYACYARGGKWPVSSDQIKETKVDAHRPLWNLCMLGDGELKEKLLAHCEVLGLGVAMCSPWELTIDDRKQKTVCFPGFRQIEELPRFYANAGAFVHASTTEQWGLVVNEAMASGLPVIVSNRVGCARDLVAEGVNGFTFDPFNVEQLTRLLDSISAFNFPISTFGGASRSIISNWGPDRFACGLKMACEAARIGKSERFGLSEQLLFYLLVRR